MATDATEVLGADSRPLGLSLSAGQPRLLAHSLSLDVIPPTSGHDPSTFLRSYCSYRLSAMECADPYRSAPHRPTGTAPTRPHNGHRRLRGTPGSRGGLMAGKRRE